MIKIQPLHELDPARFVEWTKPAADSSPIVTFVLPMERKGAETRKNSIVFKNALTRACQLVEEQWSGEAGLRQALEEPSLAQLKEPTAEFWQRQAEGLILVVREGRVPDAYALPYGMDPYVHVGVRPYLVPALRLLDSLRFCMLVLDLNELRLLESTEWQTTELPLENGPRNLEDAMRYDDPERFLQVRSVSGSNLPGPGAGNVAFHGHGGSGQEIQKKRIRRFFEMVASHLAANVPNQDLPVALCGPDFEISMFRQIYGERYPRLCEEDMVLNPSSLSRNDLNESLRKWVAGRNSASRQSACGRLKEQLGRGRASIKFEEVVRGAVQGRVASLFLCPEFRCFGLIEPVTGEVFPHEQWMPGDSELVAEAALATAASGGQIRCFGPGEPLPEASPLAAVFRY